MITRIVTNVTSNRNNGQNNGNLSWELYAKVGISGDDGIIVDEKKLGCHYSARSPQTVTSQQPNGAFPQSVLQTGGAMSDF